MQVPSPASETGNVAGSPETTAMNKMANLALSVGHPSILSINQEVVSLDSKRRDGYPWLQGLSVAQARISKSHSLTNNELCAINQRCPEGHSPNPARFLERDAKHRGRIFQADARLLHDIRWHITTH
jgi:hypothetical protein